MPTRFANQFSTEFMIGGVAATPVLVGVGFGFEATHVRIRNAGGVPVHFSLKSTSLASTDDPELEAGALLLLDRVVTSGLAITTSSTTTSTAAGVGNRITVSAWEGL